METPIRYSESQIALLQARLVEAGFRPLSGERLTLLRSEGAPESRACESMLIELSDTHAINTFI